MVIRCVSSASLRAKTLQADRRKVKLSILKKTQFARDITLHLFLNIAKIDNYRYHIIIVEVTSHAETCCILTSEIKGNSVPVSAIWHSSERDLCHYLDTGTVWLKLPKA